MSDHYELFLYEETRRRPGSACSGLRCQYEELEVSLGSTDFAGPERVNEAIVTLKGYRMTIRGIGEFFTDVRTFLEEESYDMIFDLATSAMLGEFLKDKKKFHDYVAHLGVVGRTEGYNDRCSEVSAALRGLVGDHVSVDDMKRRNKETEEDDEY